MTEIEKIKAGVALLPKLKNDLRCLVTNDALPAQTQPIAAIIAALEACKEALTPSGKTKSAYIGEFSFDHVFWDESGFERVQNIQVPWTTIKEIMKAIKARALTI